MDHTITWENSGQSFIRYARRQGLVSWGHVVKGVVKIVLYRLSLLNIESWYEKNMEALSGARVEDLDAFCRVWFRETLAKAVYREALELIESHRLCGRRVVIISNAPPFFVRPMAQALKIEDIITTEAEVEDGVLTGRLVKPLCYGEGKRFHARRWADGNGIDLQESYFYTDSSFDAALLQSVGHPFATNPDVRLRRAALENGWPVLVFRRERAELNA